MKSSYIHILLQSPLKVNHMSLTEHIRSYIIYL
nr:MAG TPA: hypothetical protein [Caudoviricetes sp.]